MTETPQTQLCVWADTVYSTAPALPSALASALERRSSDPVMWALNDSENTARVSAFIEWRRSFVHTQLLGPLDDMVALERILADAGSDHPLGRQRSLDQISFSSAWWEATSVVPTGSSLRTTLSRVGAAAATARALGATTRLRHGLTSWPSSSPRSSQTRPAHKPPLDGRDDDPDDVCPLTRRPRHKTAVLIS
jgi:hypothetical protein